MHTPPTVPRSSYLPIRINHFDVPRVNASWGHRDSSHTDQITLRAYHSRILQFVPRQSGPSGFSVACGAATGAAEATANRQRRIPKASFMLLYLVVRPAQRHTRHTNYSRRISAMEERVVQPLTKAGPCTSPALCRSLIYAGVSREISRAYQRASKPNRKIRRATRMNLEGH